MTVFKSLIRFFKIVRLILADNIVSIPKSASKIPSKELLIVKTDAIGDYILFRNLLPYIRNSKRFQGYKIVLLGNVIWKDLAEFYDKDFVDEFIWIQSGKFRKDRQYRNIVLSDIGNRSFELVLNPTRSRYLEIDDALVKQAKANAKLGRVGDSGNIPSVLKSSSARIYTELFPENENVIFEFDTNKHFISQLCNQEIKTDLPSIHLSKKTRRNNIIIIPGAGEERKRWRAENFAQVIKNLPPHLKEFRIQYLGGLEDFDIAAKIITLSGISGENLCGKTTLTEACNIIAEGSLVIANDTGLMHIAAATQTPCICVINGIHLGRFAPYPIAAKWMHFIYPPLVQTEMDTDFKKYQNIYRYNTGHHVNEILPEMIINKLVKINIPD